MLLPWDYENIYTVVTITGDKIHHLYTVYSTVHMFYKHYTQSATFLYFAPLRPHFRPSTCHLFDAPWRGGAKSGEGTTCDEKCNCTFLDLFSCTTRYRALCYAFGHAPLAQWLVDAEKDANAQLCFYLPPSASCCPPRCQPAQFVWNLEVL